MRDIPELVSRKNLRSHWKYLDEGGNIVAIVARHDDAKGSSKKWFHQYRLDKDGKWVEGAPTPLPLYGLDSIPNHHSEEKVYIFEGEKCAAAAQHLGFTALTSMMGSGQAQNADWAILTKFRHQLKEFAIIPDDDAPGHKYAKTVFKEIQKFCPNARISVCMLPAQNKGADLVDWI